MPERPPLIDALVGIQRANSWTDQYMADQLHMERQMWSYLRRGERQPGVETLRSIARAFPNLGDAVRAFVAPPVSRVA